MSDYDFARESLAVVTEEDFKVTQPVETLEDRFAMAALNGILAHGSVWGSDEAMVKRCFLIARACMAERSKK